MKKLGNITETRLRVQAEEAEDLGLTKLAEAVNGIIYDNEFRAEKNLYSEAELETEIYGNIWKIASTIMSYHDVNHPDIVKINNTIKYLQKNAIEELKRAMNVSDETIGPFEPKVAGED